MLHFVVPGDAVGKERARVVVSGGRVRAFTPGKTAAFEHKVRLMADMACGAQRWTFTPKDRFRVEVRIARQHAERGPDIDNVVKGVLDALNGVAWRDDSHVRELAASICHAPGAPGVEVSVWKLGGTEP
jgi:Holliday junction resolvase RusA-like endonuclease